MYRTRVSEWSDHWACWRWYGGGLSTSGGTCSARRLVVGRPWPSSSDAAGCRRWPREQWSDCDRATWLWAHRYVASRQSRRLETCTLWSASRLRSPSTPCAPAALLIPGLHDTHTHASHIPRKRAVTATADLKMKKISHKLLRSVARKLIPWSGALSQRGLLLNPIKPPYGRRSVCQ